VNLQQMEKERGVVHAGTVSLDHIVETLFGVNLENDPSARLSN